MTKWTQAAPKYGPTSDYGNCEAQGCEANARSTCAVCHAHACFGHAEHETHAAATRSGRTADN